ncbi:DUF6203 family protein [Sphaerisporangium sp. NPDC051017]|uniref:DUF6203 family protein n=1 Tax=Sphaerisporangium sp. NPDC051017 TaxID=3154636 RepID=UPI0034282CA6
MLRLLVTRRLARTPFGLAVLGAGWWFTHRQRARKAAARPDVPRVPGRRPAGRYTATGPSPGGRDQHPYFVQDGRYQDGPYQDEPNRVGP